MVKKKPVIKQTSRENELIKSLEGSEYIKNPLLYSQIRADMTLMQTNIFIAVVTSIQDRINQHIGDGGIVGPLFSKEELSKGKIPFYFPLTILGVDTKVYATVENVCNSLQTMKMAYQVEEDGKKGWKQSVIFPDITIMKSETGRRTGEIKLEMNSYVADMLFNKSSAYVEHLKDIARICRSPRTPRLYIYLSAWRKNFRSKTFNYDAVKEFLGFLEYNESHTRVINDKCPTFSYFKRDVLNSAQRELQELAEQGSVEFYFTYEPVYNGVKKRGNPDAIMFNIIPSPVRNNRSDNAVEELVEDKPNDVYLTGTSLGDFNLLQQLAEAGDNWAKSMMEPGAIYNDEYVEILRQKLNG